MSPRWSSVSSQLNIAQNNHTFGCVAALRKCVCFFERRPILTQLSLCLLCQPLIPLYYSFKVFKTCCLSLLRFYLYFFITLLNFVSELRYVLYQCILFTFLNCSGLSCVPFRISSLSSVFGIEHSKRINALQAELLQCQSSFSCPHLTRHQQTSVRGF